MAIEGEEVLLKQNLVGFSLVRLWQASGLKAIQSR